MIPGALIARLKMLTESTIQSTEPVRAVPADPPALKPGDRFRAIIQTMQPDGTYRAEVAGRALTLSLPTKAEPGDQLELVVTRRESGQTSEAGRPLITARLAEPPAQTSPAPQLSSTARLIGTLLTGTDAKPVPLAAGAPLMSAADPSAARMAPLLREAVAQSGVFYEAHQAQWIEGRTTLQSLMQEPQAKLPPGTVLALPTPSQRTAQAVADSAPAATPLDAIKVAASDLAQPAADVTTILHKQLDMLATQQLAWQVQLWPGQVMEWEIDAPYDREATQQDDLQREWQTRLRLTLPNLGDVSAEIALTGDRVRLNLHAANAQSATRLADARAALAGSMDASGLQLALATVDQRG